MIRINLLTVERERTKKKSALAIAGPSFGLAQRLTLACSMILLGTGLYIGWRYLSLTRESNQIDTDIGKAQEEAGRLHGLILQVQQFEQRRAQLSQRVTLIEQLRKGQTGPVHMLDQISRSLPPMLWLTELKEGPSGDVVLDGRCTTLTGLSDFVANLEATGYFKKSIEIVSSQTEAFAGPPPVDLIKFSVRAIFQPPGSQGPGATVPAAVAAARQQSAAAAAPK
jgi:type IV pilus assembly protein PilN